MLSYGPHETEHDFDGVMRLANGYHQQVGVAVTQDARGIVHGEVHGRASPAAVREQVARILSLDYDAREFVRVIRSDCALTALHRRSPGLRPVLFYSPYEAAVWSILTVRRARAQAMVLNDRLAESFGRTFTIAGKQCSALPTPEVLATVDALPSLPERWLSWLRSAGPGDWSHRCPSR